MIDTCTGAWSSPGGSCDMLILTVTGMTADEAPEAPEALPEPLPEPPEPAAADGVATRPTADTTPWTVVVPPGIVTSTWSPGRTAGPPTVSETVTTGVSEVPDSSAAPGAAGLPSDSVAAVTRSGPGRNATWPSGIVPVAVSRCARCHRSTATWVDQPYWPSAGPGR